MVCLPSALEDVLHKCEAADVDAVFEFLPCRVIRHHTHIEMEAQWPQLLVQRVNHVFVTGKNGSNELDTDTTRGGVVDRMSVSNVGWTRQTKLRRSNGMRVVLSARVRT